MSKKNRNWLLPPKDESLNNDDIDSLDFGTDEFETNENNLQEPSPVETPVVEPKQEEVPTPIAPEEKQTIIEHKEEPMPTTEVKHQEVTPAAEQPAQNAPETDNTVKKPIVTQKHDAVTRFNMVTKRYIALARNGINTEDQKKQAVAILSEIVYLVTTSHDRAVFDACLSFFLVNKAIMLSEQTVMSSVTHYADQTKINRIIQFYVVFTSLVESKLLRKRYTININHVRDVFNNKKLAEWLADKR